MRNIGIPDAPLDPEVVTLAQRYANRREALLDMCGIVLRYALDAHPPATHHPPLR
jgi:hypothetical protein